MTAIQTIADYDTARADIGAHEPTPSAITATTGQRECGVGPFTAISEGES